VKRRELITLLGGAAVAWPLSARAQQPDRIRRVGVLMGLAEDDPDSKARLAAFRQGLEKLGWSEGRNIRLDVRFALPADEQQAQMLAKELLGVSPDAVVAQTTALTAAFRRQSRNVPIVFIAVGDPIGAGFIANLARPGSNLTGLTLYDGSVAGKWLEMLKEIDPRVTRAAFIINPKTSSFPLLARETEIMAQSLAIELTLALSRTLVTSGASLSPLPVCQTAVWSFRRMRPPPPIVTSSSLWRRGTACLPCMHGASSSRLAASCPTEPTS
jgi:putative tryptophan/tyrosine transport system substrate-binding protein